MLLRLALSACLSSSVCAELYQCRDADGNRYFSDRICDDNPSSIYQTESEIYQWKLNAPSKAEQQLLDQRSKSSLSSQSNRKSQNSQQACRAFTATQLRNYRVKDQLAKGMSKPYLEKRFGHPDQVEVSGRKEKWFYTELRVKRKLTFKDDCLIGWKENSRNKSKISKYNE